MQAPLFPARRAVARLRFVRVHHPRKAETMKKPLVIFGAGDIAELAHFYFTHDSDREVAAFTVDEAWIDKPVFCALPVVAFESLASTYPADKYDIFIALSYSKLNAIRKEKYLAAKAMGYGIASYVSSRAYVPDPNRIGENCFILEDNTIQPFATIGNNVTLWSGNHIGHHSQIGDHTFVASHIVVSGGVKIGEQCFIGVNATLRDHIQIGDKCVVGAGAILLANAESEGVYIGQGTERSRVPSTRLRGI
ncbi:sugar O-acyltransferase (sialic acid O-acetyltransferase NeuD family) [Paraburkholderia youngii]|uniref:acetyltransferase n=1 Tax=Paraburkholderia youngii TaxID=2782701 RepID=UPI003D214FC5